MKIKDLLSPRAIRLNAPAESKSQAIDALVELHAAAGNLTDPSAYKAAILAREGQGTTAIGGTSCEERQRGPCGTGGDDRARRCGL